MLAKYEEKTFENYFNAELDRRASIFFPFGQVQEGSIGADASSFSRDLWLWRHFGYRFRSRLPYEGIDLRLIAEEMEIHLCREISGIPSMQTNLLFQYKRPAIISSKRGSEWSHWKQKYFRYDIYQEQQKLLSHLASKFGSKALVLYACPAIENVNDLVDAKMRGCLIELTNFRPASDLTGHHRNTFINAGAHSIACSEPEQLKHFDLLLQLQELKDERSVDNFGFVIQTADKIRAIAMEDEWLGGAYRTAIRNYLDAGLENFPLFNAISSMSIFRELSGIQWALAINQRVKG